ncbi:MAG: RluA family pseudouridine synthase [Clostridia bacterium]|nr:RluA family pseudouridine synthase [Clostridia bacterium]
MELIFEIKDNKFYNVKEIIKSHFQISDRLLTKLKKEKRIFLNNKPVYVTEQVQAGDLLKLDMNFVEDSDNILPVKMDLDIVYEDDYLLIVNKPPFLPVHPSCYHYDNSLSNGIKYYFNSINLKRKIRPINRLDKDTSGLVIFAKHEYIQEALVKQMKAQLFKKEYIAILTGNLEKSFGTINAPIARKAGSIMEREISESGETAISHFELIKNLDNFCVVKYTLETGRTHQLRVHSKYISHPILGDTLYGEESTLIDRQALHAYKISFIHPITQKELILETELPNDIKQLLCNMKEKL